MTLQGITRVPAVVLSAVALGLVACPLWFVAAGALRQYPAMFSVVMVPTFIAGAALLLRRYLSGPAAGYRRSLLWLEIPSWLGVGAFAFFVSGMGLVTPFEHAGALAVSLLATAALWMPLLLWRRTRLEEGISRLSPAAAALAATLILLAIGLVAIGYLRMPARFIGGPRGEPPPIG